jgi:hypothetical protein
MNRRSHISNKLLSENTENNPTPTTLIASLKMFFDWGFNSIEPYNEPYIQTKTKKDYSDIEKPILVSHYHPKLSGSHY